MPFITQGKTNWKFLLIVIILAIIVGGGTLWYVKRPEKPYQPPEIKKTEEKSTQEQGCIDSGGIAKTGSCCQSVSDFPNSCLIGACGCSLDNSHQVKVCDCGEGKCFDGEKCISQGTTEQETADWKTYTNTQYGFEIQYPQTLTLIQNLVNSGAEFSYCITEQEDSNYNCKAIVGFEFPDGLKIGLFALQKDKVEAKYGPSSNPNVWYKPTSNYIYELVYVEGDTGSIADRNIFNQILSTFQFKASPVSPSSTPPAPSTPEPSQSSIGNFVWDDKNADGIQAADEPGIAGVLVVLYDGLGNFVDSTTTNSAGFYTFTVKPDTYSEVFVLPKGYVFSPQDQGSNNAIDSDVDSSNGKTVPFTVAAGQVDLTWDAGLHIPTEPSAVIGDFVWRDNNYNGLQDKGEPGIPYIWVFLYDNTGNVGSTITDLNGNYYFTVKPGTYSLYFALKPITLQDVPPDDTIDSDADPSSGYTTWFTVAAGQVDLTWDAGKTPHMEY